MSLAGRLLVVATVIAAGACESAPTGPLTYRGDGLTAIVAPPQLSLSNESDKRILYKIVEQDIAPLVDFCFLCGLRDDSIEPSNEAVVEFSKILGYEAGKSKAAIIHWVKVDASEQGVVFAGPIQVMVVDL